MPRPATSGVPAASAADTDNALQEQVLVAALADGSVEVHVASLDVEARVLRLREAAVRPGGELSLGMERTVPLSGGSVVDVSEGVVGIISPEGRLLVQMHLESPEDQAAWADGLRKVLGSADVTAKPENGQEARSRQLQARIRKLEALGERRDKQLQKMVRRLDGAMQMLAAVQDMCDQQRKVITAQTVAIRELKQELGEEMACSADREPAQKMQATEAAEAEAEISEKAQEMLKLLQQVDEMQRALAQLQSMEANVTTGRPAAQTHDMVPNSACTHGQAAMSIGVAHPTAANDSSGTSGTPAFHSVQTDKEQPNDEEENVPKDLDENTAAVLGRLASIEAEKQRYEDMLRSSQQEHEGLLQRLNDMRNLMAVLGIRDDEAS